MRNMTVGQLKEKLEEFEDDMRLLVVHQPSWPLQEEIQGVWVDDGTPEEGCDCDHIWEVHNAEGCTMCDCEEGLELNKKPICYLVVNGHPYDLTPYGSKRAFNEI